jgi:hypothetical protein
MNENTIKSSSSHQNVEKHPNDQQNDHHMFGLASMILVTSHLHPSWEGPWRFSLPHKTLHWLRPIPILSLLKKHSSCWWLFPCPLIVSPLTYSSLLYPIHVWSKKSEFAGFLLLIRTNRTNRIWHLVMPTSLVGGFNPSEKYWSVGMIIPNIWGNKSCSKPPTSHISTLKLPEIPW